MSNKSTPIVATMGIDIFPPATGTAGRVGLSFGRNGRISEGACNWSRPPLASYKLTGIKRWSM